VPIRSQFLSALCEMNHRNQPVPVLPNVEYDIAVNIIRISEYAADFRKIVPANVLDNAHPCRNFAGGVRVVCHRLSKVLAGYDMHSRVYFTICEDVKNFFERGRLEP